MCIAENLTKEYMKLPLANILSAKSLGIESVLFNRFQEQYEGCQVNSFEELDEFLQSF